MSTGTVGVLIVFNNRQYYNVTRSSNEQEAWAAESRKPFCTLDRHYTHITEKQTESEASRYNVSQFVNLNFSHLISLKFSELTPKLMVKLLWCFKKYYTGILFPFLSFPPTRVYILWIFLGETHA